MTNPWSDTRPGKHRLNRPRDTRQHAACPVCFSDAISDDETALLHFTCPRGHQYTLDRGASLLHTTYLARFSTGQEPNR